MSENLVTQELSPQDLLKNLKKLNLPTWEDFLSLNEIDENQLPNLFAGKIAEFFELGKDHVQLINENRWFSLINFLYQAWSLTKNLPSEHKLFEFSQSIRSYDDIIQNYGQNTSPNQRNALIFWLGYFSENVLHPERILKLYQPNSKYYDSDNLGIYQHQGIWRPLPTNDDEVTFVEEAVIKEICDVQESLSSSEANLFHETGSSALEAIARHQALLSASESEKRANPIKTGEYQHKVHDVESSMDKSQRLQFENIYASNLLANGYSMVRWFDEYPAIFGFQASEAGDFYKSLYGGQRDFLGLTAHGHELGGVIPLELVRAVYTFQPHLNELKSWAKQQVPRSKVISLEAGSLLRTRSDAQSRLYPSYLYRFDDPVVKDWQAFLEEEAIDL